MKETNRSHRSVSLVLAAASLFLVTAIPVFAGGEKNRNKKTVKAGARTAGHAARDGARTAGHTVKAFFNGGAPAAKKAAKQGAATTKKNAKTNAAATKSAAKSK